jgi:hypothetical protein
LSEGRWSFARPTGPELRSAGERPSRAADTTPAHRVPSLRTEGSDEPHTGAVKGAAAAPRCPRRIGLATLALLGLSSMGFAAPHALAGQASPQLVTEPTMTSSTTSATVAAPPPDPKPSPAPDPKPVRPRPRTRVTPPPPPPPPPPAATRRSTPRSTQPEAPAASPRQPARAIRRKVVVRKVVVPKKPESAAAKTRRETQPVRKRQPPARKRNRSSIAAPALKTPDLEALPAPVLAGSEPEVSGPLPFFLSLVGLGLLLLIAASVVSFRRVPLLAVAEPLYERRSDLTAIGLGVIALALLSLNVTVFL